MAHRQKIVRRGILRRPPSQEDLPVEEDIESSEESELDNEEIETSDTEESDAEESDVEEPDIDQESVDLTSLRKKIKANKKNDLADVTVIKERAPMRKKGTNPISDILEYMHVGSIIVILREDQDSWKVTVTDKKFSGIINPFVSSGAKLSGKTYWETVINPEYAAWSKEWNLLTFAEKKNRAKKLGVEWEHNNNPKVEVMLLTDAVRKHLGLTKYRPEFATRSARANIRAK